MWNLLSSSSVLISVLPIISCSNDINHKIGSNEKEIKNLEEYIETNPYIKQFDMNNLSINIWKPEEFNMFELLTNNSILNSNFQVKKDDFIKNNQKWSIYFNFDYTIEPDFGKILKPRLTNQQNKIIIPVNIRIVNDETFISASTYIDLFTIDIIDTIVNNKEDKGYNGQKGKTVQINYDKNKKINFLDVPNQIIEPYINLFLDFDKKNLFKTPVIYEDILNGKISTRWKNKTLQEVYSLSNAIKAPLNLISDKSNPHGLKNNYRYSIESVDFDQHEWKFARFKVKAEVLLNNSKIIKDASDKYQLDLFLNYSYIDKRWAFKLPNEDSIKKAISNNESIASKISSEANKNIFSLAPKVNISTLEAADKGVDKIVKRFKSAKDFLPPQSFVYTILDDDKRNVFFEITNLSKSNDDEIKIDIQVNVGSNRLIGKATYSKTFNIKLWKFV